MAVSSPGSELDLVSRREGVRTVGVPMERNISLFRDLKSLIDMTLLFRREKPYMVHSITPKAGLISMIAAWICRVPVRLHMFTGLVFPTATGFKQKVLIFTDKITSACATHIVPEGEGVKNDLIRFGITDKPLKVLGHGNINGIDLEYFNPESPEVAEAAAKIRDNGVFTFVYVGRLVGDKGIHELVDAFVRLHSVRPATRLLLVGYSEGSLDPLRQSTLDLIAQHEGIVEAGEQEDVRPWLAAADALVFPSYREGFPNVVIEGGAMNLPSVVTDINGSREIIMDGVNGLIVPPRNTDALHDAMLCIVDDPELCKKLGEASRGLIASRYERSFVQACLKEYYESILPAT